LDPGWVKSKNRIRDEHPRSESLENFFGVKIHKFFDADADPGIFLTMDPGREKFGSGINIPDPQHWHQYADDKQKIMKYEDP
jgi:hypothetical protein